MVDPTPMIPLPVVEPARSDVRQWRSLAHLDGDPAFAELTREEFLPGASDAPGESSRRRFLQILGASMAMAGLVGCRKPVEHVMPFAQRPEDLVPGIPVRFATGMPLRGVLHPVLVKSHDGRPTKVEGNALHPASSGATGVFEQASILSLYDPDRSQHVLRDGGRATWEEFVAFCGQLHSGAAGRRLAVLSAETNSPTVRALRAELQEQYGALTWVTYRPEGDDHAALGMQAAFGQPYRVQYDFASAEVIVSLDADFLGPTARNVAQATHSFAQGRRLRGANDEMSRLYVAESAYSVTGSLADHRKRMRSSEIPELAARLAARLGITTDGAGDQNDPFVTAMADDLLAAGSRGIVLAGDTQPAAVHALCSAINAQLGSIGSVVTLLDTGEEMVASQAEELAGLAGAMRAGEVDALLLLGVNPLYDAPQALDFAAAMSQVADTVHVGLHVDETASVAAWHVPQTHYLEAWGDGRAYGGTQSVVQPLIAPLYDAAHSAIEVLQLLTTGASRPGFELVRETWRPLLTGDFEKAWRKVLHDGFLPGSAYPQASAPAVAGFNMPAPSSEASLELVFRPDPTVLCGSFANNAWCQELPDPITKIVWDNVAVMSPQTAEELGVTTKYRKGRYYVDVITLSANGHGVDLPVWIVPGHADGSIAVNLGYGRAIATEREERLTPFWDTDDKTDVYGNGSVCTGVGQNVAVLRDSVAGPVIGDVQVEKTGEAYRIITTQDHGILDVEARPLIRMATLSEYRDNPGFALDAEAPTPGSDEKTSFEAYPTLWENSHPAKEHALRDSSYYRNQWGMTIDLNSCTGCGACIVACQAENNIQVVGKEEIGNGRELHWLRVDRYFVTSGDTRLTGDPQMVLQPVPCQHCENAPCEAVCPVAATVHSPDGTNQMIYNRCIGTRYCANNCPYKVRRFNFFNWAKTIPETVQMAQNPNVSVRSRGVMEKCSFCIQRVRDAQKNARLEKRALYTDEVQTACQQSCAAEAITFGDLNDPNSAVSRERANSRNYTMLAELNIKPRVSYLARVRNPNEALEEAS